MRISNKMYWYMRLELPYGRYLRQDNWVFFNRRYQPLAIVWPDGVAYGLDRDTWVDDYIGKQWLYNDECPPWACPHTLARVQKSSGSLDPDDWSRPWERMTRFERMRTPWELPKIPADYVIPPREGLLAPRKLMSEHVRTCPWQHFTEEDAA